MRNDERHDMPMKRLIPLLVAAVALLALPGAALAQNPFAPAAHVDDRVVTRHEVEQRALFLQLFNTPGDLREQALERLIEERLQQAEASRLGIRLAEAEITAGMEEFAGRFDLTADQFAETIAQGGVTRETFRAFVEAGLAWRAVLSARFGGRITVLESDIDRALSLTAQRGPVRLLLNELILPDTPDNRELAEDLSRRATPDEFEEAARLYSASATRLDGGRLGWVALSSLPEGIQTVVGAMSPGQVSPPINIEGAVVLFLLRGIDRSLNLPASAIRVEYGRALLPPATAATDLATLRARADSCADLLPLLGHLPEAAAAVESGTLASLPQAVAARLARLDPGEISAEGRADGAVEVLMLCSRTPGGDALPDRNSARVQLSDRRLSQEADGLLAELRAAAVIRRR
jgi:peptidyl-prolyl cis-trans isomerase SurA